MMKTNPFFFQLCILFFLFSAIAAQEITVKTQKIRFINATTHETEKTVDLSDLAQWQDPSTFIANWTVSSNETIDDQGQKTKSNVSLCYINDTNGHNYEMYKNRCLYFKNETTGDIVLRPNVTWVLVSVATKDQDQNIDVMINASNYNESHVQGLIMVSRYYPRQLNSENANETEKFKHPSIMGITDPVDEAVLKMYSWNAGNQTDTDGIYWEFAHEYIDRCYLLDTMRWFYLLFIVIFGITSIVWSLFTFYLWQGANQAGVQKWFLVIPITKALEEIEKSLFFFTCPWNITTTVIYITNFAQQILQILIVICQSTVINSIFYLVAVGWGTTMQTIQKNTITNVMIVGGSMYLIQLAKTYSESDMSSYPILFNSILIIEYIILCRVNYVSASQQLKKMIMMVNSVDLIPPTFVPGLKVKIHQIKVFRVCMVLFYLSEIAYNSYITISVFIIQSEDEYQRYIVMTVLQVYDIFVFGTLLYAFRPRKEWPEFFGLGVDQFMYRFEPGNRVGRQNGGEGAAVPLDNFHINTDDVFDHALDETEPFSLDDSTKDYFAILGTRQPILIINPCDLTESTFLAKRQISDNPYIQRDDEDVSYQMNLFHNLKIAALDLKQQKRKHKLKGANSKRRKTEVGSSNAAGARGNLIYQEPVEESPMEMATAINQSRRATKFSFKKKDKSAKSMKVKVDNQVKLLASPPLSPTSVGRSSLWQNPDFVSDEEENS